MVMMCNDLDADEVLSSDAVMFGIPHLIPVKVFVSCINIQKMSFSCQCNFDGTTVDTVVAATRVLVVLHRLTTFTTWEFNSCWAGICLH